MRVFKLAVISLIIIFLLFTFIGLLLPSSVTVTRKEFINVTSDSVRFYTNNIYHWKYWLNGVDTNYKSSTEKNTKIKLGAYTISVLKNNPENIITLWQGKNTRDRVCHIQLSNSDPNATTVYMSFQQHLSWLPWDRLGGMLHDEVIGPSIQASLDKLKQVVEKTSD
ncbi:MAG TPA: hypothetical protein VGI61_01640 [Parafilimonas sp.]